MLTCWSIEDLSSFFCLLQNCVSVGYNKLLFHEWYDTLITHQQLTMQQRSGRPLCPNRCTIYPSCLEACTQTVLIFHLVNRWQTDALLWPKTEICLSTYTKDYTYKNNTTLQLQILPDIYVQPQGQTVCQLKKSSKEFLISIFVLILQWQSD
jgi:hypothetical protein